MLFTTTKIRILWIEFLKNNFYCCCQRYLWTLWTLFYYNHRMF